MLDLRPALQLRTIGNTPVLVDLLASKSFEISDARLMPIIAVLADLVPDAPENLIEGLLEELEIERSEAEAAIEALTDLELLKEASSLTSQKAGVQFWVDKGWIDALVLHFSSRDLIYADDPKALGGEEDVNFIPDTFQEGVPLRPRADEGAVYRLIVPDDAPEGAQLIEAMMSRRSFKPFTRPDLSVGELDRILWFANLYVRERSAVFEATSGRDRAYDSAFSCLHSYVIIYRPIEGSEQTIPSGAYYYDPIRHSLVQVAQGDFRGKVAEIAIGQRRASKGLFTIAICADWENYARRYPHERSYRNLLINTSQLAQFYLVLSTVLKLNTFMTPAIHDEEMAKFLGIDDAIPLYIVTAG